MPSYKLYYFNAKGAGEPIRIIFAQAGVKYEDFRFEGEDWGKKYKAGTIQLRHKFVVRKSTSAIRLLLTKKQP